nr:MAG TPA: minor tail protein [Caudoviricetes sp.]
MADFESLNISITANADSASNSINSLVQSLGGLRQALSSFSVDKGLERSLGSITTVVNGLNSAASSLNVSGFKDIGTGVSAFSNSLSELNGALSTIDSKSFTSASRSITKLFSSLSQTAPQDISLAISNISALSTAMAEMQSMMENVDGKAISGFARRLTTLSIGLSSLSSAEVSSDSIRGISDGIISITQAVDTISDESLERIEKLSASLSQLARVANATPSMNIQIPDMGGAGGGGRARGNSRITAFTNSYADSLKKSLGTSIRLAGRGASETMHGLSSALRELYKGFGLGHIGSSQFLSDLARIAKYRFLRSIIKSITSGIKTGLQNIAHYSAEANAALSQLSTGSLYLKNSLGAALYPAISSLIGVFSSLVGVIVRALNVLNMLFSLLGGKGTYIRATKQTKDFTKATGAAGGAAKALKQELMGFDEINALSPDGGGGGGGDDCGIAGRQRRRLLRGIHQRHKTHRRGDCHGSDAFHYG